MMYTIVATAVCFHNLLTEGGQASLWTPATSPSCLSKEFTLENRNLGPWHASLAEHLSSRQETLVSISNARLCVCVGQSL